MAQQYIKSRGAFLGLSDGAHRFRGQGSSRAVNHILELILLNCQSKLILSLSQLHILDQLFEALLVLGLLLKDPFFPSLTDEKLADPLDGVREPLKFHFQWIVAKVVEELLTARKGPHLVGITLDPCDPRLELVLDAFHGEVGIGIIVCSLLKMGLLFRRLGQAGHRGVHGFGAGNCQIHCRN